jgi:hypothetical protein
MELLMDRYKGKIAEVFSCYDRLVFSGSLPQLCYAKWMTGYLNGHGIKIFDYPKFVEPYREKLRSIAEAKAQTTGFPIEFVRHSTVRKEDIVRKA